MEQVQKLRAELRATLKKALDAMEAELCRERRFRVRHCRYEWGSYRFEAGVLTWRWEEE